MTMSSDQDYISRYVCHVLILLSSPPFYDTYVQLPNNNYTVPNKISSNSKLSPYFDNTLGATDGTQISCLPSSEEQESSHNHKGGITQNILACCSFDLRFQYFLSGDTAHTVSINGIFTSIQYNGEINQDSAVSMYFS
jgi:hypothetical protein